MTDSTLKYFIYLLTFQLFYSFGMTLLTYGMSPMLTDTGINEQYDALSVDMENITTQIDDSLQSQLDIPVIDMGALVFYSGNILIDLFMNFITAIPSAITLLFSTFNALFGVDAYIMTMLKLFIYSFGTILYVISLIIFLMNLRSGGVTAV